MAPFTNTFTYDRSYCIMDIVYGIWDQACEKINKNQKSRGYSFPIKLYRNDFIWIKIIHLKKINCVINNRITFHPH